MIRGFLGDCCAYATIIGRGNHSTATAVNVSWFASLTAATAFLFVSEKENAS
jgi:hypothetical protein